MPDSLPSSAQPVYSIGAVTRMLGVAASTLRSWEERYSTVVPHRSEGGHRLYSRDQVEQLRFVVDHVNQGLQAGEAHRLLEAAGGRPYEAPGSGEAAERTTLVLLAERDPFAAELSEFFLRTEGYDVVVELDPARAETVNHDRHPDVVIIELLMAGGGGTGLCRELSRRGATVLATSALDLRDEALDAGAVAFLLKPFEPLHLVSAVRDLLGTSALTRVGGKGGRT